MGSSLLASYPSSWYWKNPSNGPADGLWSNPANWTITGSPSSGCPTFNRPAYITSNGALVMASDANGARLYVGAPTSTVVTGVAPVLNFTGGSNEFNNGWVDVGSGGSNYGGIINMTGGFLWGNYNSNTNNLSLTIASQGAGYTNAVGTFSIGSTNAATAPNYLGGTNGTVSIGTNPGENGTLLCHDSGNFFTYGVDSNGAPSFPASAGGSITVGGNGGIGTVNVKGHQMLIGTQDIIFGGASAGTANLVDTLDSTKISYLFAANSIKLGTHAYYYLRVSGMDFNPALPKTYITMYTWGTLTGKFLDPGTNTPILEGEYLSIGGYKFKASYQNNNQFSLTVSAAPVWSGTLNITGNTGQTRIYDGINFLSTNPNIPAVTISTTDPVILQNCTLKGPGNLIKDAVGYVNVTVKNCTGYGYNPTSAPFIPSGGTKLYFVEIGNTLRNLDVENCYVEGCGGGVHVNGGFNGPGNIIIKKNQFKNMDARYSNGAGGYQSTDHAKLHTIHISGDNGGPWGVPFMEIAWNEMINMPWNSAGEDVINIWDASGQSGYPFQIHDNYIYGAWPTNPLTETYNGSGIIVEGATTSAAKANAFINVFNNQVVGTDNCGLALCGGHDNHVYNNRVVCSNYLQDGTWLPNNINGYGLVGNNWYNETPSVMYNNDMNYNYVGFNATGGLKTFWGSGVPSAGNIYLSVAPTLADEAAEYLLWVQKLQTNNVLIGPVAKHTTN